MNEIPQPVVPLDEGLNAAVGIEVDDLEHGRATGHFEVVNRVKQPFGIVHGGAHAAIAETLASVGTYFTVAEQGKIAMGMSNNTTFLRPATDGTIRAEAIAIQQGSTTWIWDVTMRDDQDRVCAVSRVTIAVRPQRS